MAGAANTHARLQLVFAKILFEMRSPMHLARDKVMKTQVRHAVTQGASRS